MENTVHVVAALITIGAKVLLGRKGELLQLLGGKQEAGETEIECLRRELGEEIPDAIIVGEPIYWRTFQKLVSPRRGYAMTMNVYGVHIERGPDVALSEEESIHEIIWWQRSLGMSELTKPTQVVLKAAMRARLF
jgi:8-oxo-dGTP pyrophosphatase MutT (NUDIX family)